MKSSIESSDGYILSFTVRSQEGGVVVVVVVGGGVANMTPRWARWVGGMKGKSRANKQKDASIKKKNGSISAALLSLDQFERPMEGIAQVRSTSPSSASRGASEIRGLSEPKLTQSLSPTVTVLTFALILFLCAIPTVTEKQRKEDKKKTQTIVIYYL